MLLINIETKPPLGGIINAPLPPVLDREPRGRDLGLTVGSYEDS